MQRQRKSRFYTPRFQDHGFLANSPVEFATQWVDYYRKLVAKPLTKATATELKAARGFLAEAATLRESCRAEFASATTTERKSIASAATEVLLIVDKALREFDTAELLNLI